MKAVNKCIRCFRMKPRVVEHIIADLPKEQLDGSHAVEVTGIDFCGPFFYKSEARSKPPVKCYVSFVSPRRLIIWSWSRISLRYRFYLASNDLYALEEGRGRFGLIMQPTLLALAMSCSN